MPLVVHFPAAVLHLVVHLVLVVVVLLLVVVVVVVVEKSLQWPHWRTRGLDQRWTFRGGRSSVGYRTGRSPRCKRCSVDQT